MAVYANELRESDAAPVHMRLQLTLRHQRCDTNVKQVASRNAAYIRYDTIRYDTLHLRAHKS